MKLMKLEWKVCLVRFWTGLGVGVLYALAVVGALFCLTIIFPDVLGDAFMQVCRRFSGN